MDTNRLNITRIDTGGQDDGRWHVGRCPALMSRRSRPGMWKPMLRTLRCKGAPIRTTYGILELQYTTFNVARIAAALALADGVPVVRMARGAVDVGVRSRAAAAGVVRAVAAWASRAASCAEAPDAPRPPAGRYERQPTQRACAGPRSSPGPGVEMPRRAAAGPLDRPAPPVPHDVTACGGRRGPPPWWLRAAAALAASRRRPARAAPDGSAPARELCPATPASDRAGDGRWLANGWTSVEPPVPPPARIWPPTPLSRGPAATGRPPHHERLVPSPTPCEMVRRPPRGRSASPAAPPRWVRPSSSSCRPAQGIDRVRFGPPSVWRPPPDGARRPYHKLSALVPAPSPARGRRVLAGYWAVACGSAQPVTRGLAAAPHCRLAIGQTRSTVRAWPPYGARSRISSLAGRVRPCVQGPRHPAAACDRVDVFLRGRPEVELVVCRRAAG